MHLESTYLHTKLKDNQIFSYHFSDSPYRTPISSAILQLQEGGRLHMLKEKWWKQRKGGGKCKVSPTDDFGLFVRSPQNQLVIQGNIALLLHVCNN